MTRSARLSFVGFLVAALIFISGYAFIPTRVTFGAGSIRCGTALRPQVENEISDVCPAIGRQRLNDTAIATALFALGAAMLIPFHRWIEDRPRVRSLVTFVVVVFWLAGGALTLYALTGAYSSPGT